MTIRQFERLLKDACYPTDAILALSCDYAALLKDEGCREILTQAENRYEKDLPLSFYEESERLVLAAKRGTKVHPYAAELLFYLHLAPLLREKYQKEGLAPCFFEGVMAGILCKLHECHKMYGVWGSFVAVWFSRFFVRSLYAFGRLECCLMGAPLAFSADGKGIGKGDLVIDVHIPSRGPLKEEELEDAYRRAAEFFAPKIKGAIAFHCESWLLADFHGELLPEEAGIRLFASRYQLVERTPDEGDLWRIFYLPDDTPPHLLPEDTVLQRGYKDRLLKGLPLYGGRGFFFL